MSIDGSSDVGAGDWSAAGVGSSEIADVTPTAISTAPTSGACDAFHAGVRFRLCYCHVRAAIIKSETVVGVIGRFVTTRFYKHPRRPSRQRSDSEILSSAASISNLARSVRNVPDQRPGISQEPDLSLPLLFATPAH